MEPNNSFIKVMNKEYEKILIDMDKEKKKNYIFRRIFKSSKYSSNIQMEIINYI